VSEATQVPWKWDAVSTAEVQMRRQGRSRESDRRRGGGAQRARRPPPREWEFVDAWLVGAGLFALQFGLICGNPIVILTFVSAHFCSLSNEF
jgi:hypothetical protein